MTIRSGPRLALVLIARDEETFLPGCLASVRGVVDEVVVADTGSRDRTVAIALEAGATVVHHPWTEDFAVARNAALAATRAPWVLVLDADERLAPGAGRRILDAIEDPALDCGLLPLHDASRLDAPSEEILSGAARSGLPVLLARLFRRGPGLCWEGPIHESPVSWLAGRVERCRPIDASIIHFGAIPVLRRQLSKDDRNIRLLQRRRAEAPQDIPARVFLAGGLAGLGQLEEAWVVQEEAWALEGARSNGAGPSETWVPVARLRLQLQLDRGEVEDMADTLAQVERWTGAPPGIGPLDHPDLRFYRALSLERVADGLVAPTARRAALEDAASLLDGLLAEGPAALTSRTLDGLWGWRSCLLLATVLAQLGRWEEVIRLCDEVEAELPGDPRLAMLRAEAGIGLGAMDQVEPFLAEAVACPAADGPVLRACEALARHDLDAAASWAEEAVRRSKGGFVELHRRRHLRAVIRTLAAEGDPEPVFAGGAGRSGTTLLRVMLHGHRHLHCPPELKVVPTLLGEQEGWGALVGQMLGDPLEGLRLVDRSCRAFLDVLLGSLAPEGCRLVEKTPHNALCIETLARLYPRARFLVIVRDGRAVAESLVRQRWVDPATGQPQPYCANLAAAGAYWAHVVVETRRGACAALGRVFEVRYESLVRDPESTMRRILTFLGEDWDAAVLDPTATRAPLGPGESSNDRATAPLDPTLAEAWRARLAASEIAGLEVGIGPALTLLGYALRPDATDPGDLSASP